MSDRPAQALFPGYEREGTSSAVFSPCRRYRYVLWRCWNVDAPAAIFVGLNPSTADETEDDPTIRKCMGFARKWGFGELVMLNLFAWRATDPRSLKSTVDPVGPDNDAQIVRQVQGRMLRRVVAAWGVGGALHGRGAVVRLNLQSLLYGQLQHLGLTKAGHPRHPLYLPYETALQGWR